MTGTPEIRSREGTIDLKEMTDARVSLGRFGSGQPTRVALQFLLDHARAREAVWTTVDRAELASQLLELGLETINIQSRADERSVYIRRPDLGRCISQQSTELLRSVASKAPAEDVVIVVADGLSSSAVTINAVPLIEVLVPGLKRLGLTVCPIVLAAQARVAIADPIGEAFGSRIAIVLIGERPGLSAADSLGAYITYRPKTGTQDSDRNCVSNIREAGLPIDIAAENIIQLVQDIIRTSVSGVALKSALVALDFANC
ncbi:ethanolamine ammonia-lyase subunit EutC [Rhizobium tumorigenes]|uniref:ethanolamine ammonia-lyase subunit EutC n=1 Tax=Rhizobium tumorigenes TaxID=2041385 RepID=UPI00241D083A|nr:ethanolamine ammonia-lyase subunit EutC [Rhizobium tumorigenes]WFS03486.1 ethanolamine ammonia-lyase subunit EutC [Rhizobium tumorigenes]